MSCFQLDPQHLAAVIGSAVHRDRSARSMESVLRRFCKMPLHCSDERKQETPEGVMARTLAEANAESVNARYPGHDKVEPVLVPYSTLSRWSANPLSAVELLKAIQSVEYQSCEYDGWEKSCAAALLDCARSIAIHALPGYSGAEWSIASPPKGNAVSIFAL